jgi:hypothetical protein
MNRGLVGATGADDRGKAAQVQFIDENGGGPGVRLRKRSRLVLVF